MASMGRGKTLLMRLLSAPPRQAGNPVALVWYNVMCWMGSVLLLVAPPKRGPLIESQVQSFIGRQKLVAYLHKVSCVRTVSIGPCC